MGLNKIVAQELTLKVLSPEIIVSNVPLLVSMPQMLRLLVVVRMRRYGLDMPMLLLVLQQGVLQVPMRLGLEPGIRLRIVTLVLMVNMRLVRGMQAVVLVPAVSIPHLLLLIVVGMRRYGLWVGTLVLKPRCPNFCGYSWSKECVYYGCFGL